MTVIVLKKEAFETFNRLRDFYSHIRFSIWGKKSNTVSVFFDLLIQHHEAFNIYDDIAEAKPLQLPNKFKPSNVDIDKYEQRLYVVLDNSMEELTAILDRTITAEIAGQIQKDHRKIKEVKQQLTHSFISFHMDIFDEKTLEWQRFETITSAQATQDKICACIC